MTDLGPGYELLGWWEAEHRDLPWRRTRDPWAVLEGIAIVAYACQLDTAYFFIRGEYHHQAKVMQRAIDEAYAGGAARLLALYWRLLPGVAERMLAEYAKYALFRSRPVANTSGIS